MNVVDAIEALGRYPDDADVLNLAVRHRGKTLVLSDIEDDIEIDDVAEVLASDWPPDYGDQG